MASYSKLQSGSWGIRVAGAPPNVGDRITVDKKDGTSKVETVERVLWSGAGYDGQPASLCAIVATPRPEGVRSTQPRPRRNWSPCGYPGCSPQYCDECDGDGYVSAGRSAGRRY